MFDSVEQNLRYEEELACTCKCLSIYLCACVCVYMRVYVCVCLFDFCEEKWEIWTGNRGAKKKDCSKEVTRNSLTNCEKKGASKNEFSKWQSFIFRVDSFQWLFCDAEKAEIRNAAFVLTHINLKLAGAVANILTSFGMQTSFFFRSQWVKKAEKVTAFPSFTDRTEPISKNKWTFRKMWVGERGSIQQFDLIHSANDKIQSSHQSNGFNGTDRTYRKQMTWRNEYRLFA